MANLALRRGQTASFQCRSVIAACSVLWLGAVAIMTKCETCSRHFSGLLVDEELARAIRSETAAAVKHWFGVGTKAIWHWRKVLGVNRVNNVATHRLYVQSATMGAEAARLQGITPAERKRRRKEARRLNLIRHA